MRPLSENTRTIRSLFDNGIRQKDIATRLDLTEQAVSNAIRRYKKTKLNTTKLNTTKLNTTKLNTTKLNTTKLNTTKLNTINKDLRETVKPSEFLEPSETKLNTTKLNTTKLNTTKLNTINDTSRSKNTRGPGSKIKIITINSIFEKVIEYTSDKTGKGYERINKILKSHDNNRNYQSNIIRDAIEILIEMGRVR